MGLVDYSDSEHSDSDAGPPPPLKATPASAVNSKPAFKKVVDRSNPHKIVVNLPKTAEHDGQDNDATSNGPPAKRARVGGGAFSGFNSLLPAPKRTGQVGGSANGNAAVKGGLGRGVSLKTGATPGFTRESMPDFSSAGDDIDNGDNSPGENKDGQLPHQEPPSTNKVELNTSNLPQQEVKKVGSSMMFKPLSVARKPQKKKPATVAATTTTTAISSSAITESSMPKPAPKVSLFSFSTPEDAPRPTFSSTTGDYTPLLYQPQDKVPEEPGFYRENPYSTDITEPYPPAPSDLNEQQTLTTIAADLNLSAAARRQLFGRDRGTGNQKNASAAAINVINFNTDAEYAANEALRAAGETVQHNPVRAIAPGKHSLKQLVSAASSQKEALEEHFATGKRNKKEAGSRYGW